jgi:hypothetical protein
MANGKTKIFTLRAQRNGQKVTIKFKFVTPSHGNKNLKVLNKLRTLFLLCMRNEIPPGQKKERQQQRNGTLEAMGCARGKVLAPLSMMM